MKLQNGNGVIGGNFLASELADVRDFVDLFYSNNHNFIASLVSRIGVIKDDLNYIITGLDIKFVTGKTCRIPAGIALSATGRYFTDTDFAFVASPGELFYVLVPEDTQFGVSPNAHATNSRIDIIEVRPTVNTFNSKNRQFRDPITGVVTTSLVDTRRQVLFEFQVIQGTVGSPTPPASTAGWIKLAEITVPPLSADLTQESILLVDSNMDKENVIQKNMPSNTALKAYGTHLNSDIRSLFPFSDIPPIGERVFSNNDPIASTSSDIRYCKKHNSKIYMAYQMVSGVARLYYLNLENPSNPIFTYHTATAITTLGIMVPSSNAGLFNYITTGFNGVYSRRITVDINGVITVAGFDEKVVNTPSNPAGINDALELDDGYIAVTYTQGVEKIAVYRDTGSVLTLGNNDNMLNNSTGKLCRAGLNKFILYNQNRAWVCTNSGVTVTQNTVVELVLPSSPTTILRIMQYSKSTNKTVVLFNQGTKNYLSSLTITATSLTQDAPIELDPQVGNAFSSADYHRVGFSELDFTAQGFVVALSYYRVNNQSATEIKTYRYKNSNNSLKQIPNSYINKMDDIYLFSTYLPAVVFLPIDSIGIICVYRLVRDHSIHLKVITDSKIVAIQDSNRNLISHGVMEYSGTGKAGDYLYVDADGSIKPYHEFILNSKGIVANETPLLVGYLVTDTKLKLLF